MTVLGTPISGITVPELLSKQFNTDLRKTPTSRSNTRNHISRYWYNSKEFQRKLWTCCHPKAFVNHRSLLLIAVAYLAAGCLFAQVSIQQRLFLIRQTSSIESRILILDWLMTDLDNVEVWFSDCSKCSDILLFFFS